MYKYLVAVVTLSVSQLTLVSGANANERADIWSCVDSSKMEIKDNCMIDIIDTHTNKGFYNQLTNTTFTSQADAFATITHFPKQNLIIVKSLESKTSDSQKTNDNIIVANYSLY